MSPSPDNDTCRELQLPNLNPSIVNSLGPLVVCSCPCVVFELRPCFLPGLHGAALKARGPPRSFSDAQLDAVIINVPLPIRQLDAFLWCIVT